MHALSAPDWMTTAALHDLVSVLILVSVTAVQVRCHPLTHCQQQQQQQHQQQ
jgi:hypothetical protein